MNVSAKAPVMRDFSYDPFAPAVMADPLPYYRVLREHYPVYHMPEWDTFALSRFSDIWDVLAVSDGTFVASDGTLPAATGLAAQRSDPYIGQRAARPAAEHPELLPAYVTHIFGIDNVRAAFGLACRPEPERVKIAIVE